MPDDMAGSIKRGHKPKARKFYHTSPDYRTGAAPPYEIENRKALVWEGLTVFASHPYRRGFPDYPEPPRILLKKKAHRPIRDLEDCSGYWLISDRAKQLFEALDPESFAFVKCEVRFTDGEPGPDYWLCDVVLLLDAVDEARSSVDCIMEADGRKRHSIGSFTSLAFDEGVVGEHCVFRMKTFFPRVISSERFKIAFKQGKLTGLWFRDAFDPPFDKIGTITALPPPRGKVRLEGQKEDSLFFPDNLDAFDGSLKVGDRVRVQGRYSRNYRNYHATRLERV